MWILRWPAVLALLAYVVACAAAAANLSPSQFGVPIDEELWRAAAAGDGAATWIEIALAAATAIFLFIAFVRLIRRTQGFWAWLLGFASFGARWALSEEGGAFVAQAIGVREVNAALALAQGVPANYALLALLILLAIGLFILVIDSADKRWARAGA